MGPPNGTFVRLHLTALAPLEEADQTVLVMLERANSAHSAPSRAEALGHGRPPLPIRRSSGSA
jgi:hypothetical protein